MALLELLAAPAKAWIVSPWLGKASNDFGPGLRLSGLDGKPFRLLGTSQRDRAVLVGTCSTVHQRKAVGVGTKQVFDSWIVGECTPYVVELPTLVHSGRIREEED